MTKAQEEKVMSRNGEEIYLVRIDRNEGCDLKEREIRDFLEEGWEGFAEAKAVNFKRLWGREKHRKAFLKEMDAA